MNYKKAAAVFCLIFLLTKTIFAQQTDMLNNLQQYGSVLPQEKVYLQLDKPNYITGDNIWLKAYVTLGAQNQLSALSQILYVDLISPANQIVKSTRLLILHGVSMGDIALADTLEEGTYHLRAYTNWMRNLPEQSFFNKTLTIGRVRPDPLVTQSLFSYDETSRQLTANITLTDQSGRALISSPVEYLLHFSGKTSATGMVNTNATGSASINFNNNKNADIKAGVLSLKIVLADKKVYRKNIPVNIIQPESKIRFMPEGGDLVAGLQSRVAFKILQPDGLGGSGSGYVEDDAGTKVVEFTSEHGGMGSFFITPEAGKTYKAVVKYADGKTQTSSLPTALKEGYAIAVNLHMPTYIYLAIRATPSLVQNQKATILVQRQGKIIFVGQKVISGAESLVKLPLDNYPTGIIQITLFNENMQAVCERLFFNLNKHSLFALAAPGLVERAGTRKPVTVTLESGAPGDSVRVGSFSASVVNMANMPKLQNNETNIYSGLFLTPELKGYVEQPDYYFDGYDTKINELDNLMLCQGWRRIIWDDVKAAKLPAINYKPENGFSVSGTVTQRNGTPIQKTKVSLLSTSSWSHIDTVTDAQGRFVFDRLLLRDSSKFTIQVGKAGETRNMVVKLDAPGGLSGYVPLNDQPAPANDLAYQAFLKKNYTLLPDSVRFRLSSNVALKQVEIRADKPNKVKHSSNLNGPGVADQVFVAEDLKNSVTLKQFLQGRAMGVRFEGDDAYTTRSTISSIGGPFAHAQTEPMQIILDGVKMQVQDDHPLTNITVADVESIEILRTVANTTLYGANDGIIIITTKTGQSSNRLTPPSPDNVSLTLTGFNSIREFYSPDYATAKPSTPDHRATIYWKPDIVTDKNGNASFKFYTSDDAGSYQLCIEGMTFDGRLSHLVKTINVE